MDDQLKKVMAEGEEDLPRDAKIVKSLLKSMGVEEYEPRVVHQFLELWYRYAVDVLTDAHVYSEHAAKSMIDSEDIKLAIQSKVNFSFSQPPPREVPSACSFSLSLSLSLTHAHARRQRGRLLMNLMCYLLIPTTTSLSVCVFHYLSVRFIVQSA